MAALQDRPGGGPGLNGRDRRVVEAVKQTGRKKLVTAALWTEMCLAIRAIHAMGEGYDVYVVTDASGGVQGSTPYRKAYIENTKRFLERVDVEFNAPILEWGANLTGLNQ